MSRNPELEALLQAKYDLDTASDEQKVTLERVYFARLDAIIARSGIPGTTRHLIEEVFVDAYREFRRAKKLEERAKLGRIR
ncbi:MAG: hypothetical protein EXS35_08145 [Pedosphaera sp.]|nr:hypothetical protein [Pedosphaera sp.]